MLRELYEFIKKQLVNRNKPAFYKRNTVLFSYNVFTFIEHIKV